MQVNFVFEVLNFKFKKAAFVERIYLLLPLSESDLGRYFPSIKLS